MTKRATAYIIGPLSCPPPKLGKQSSSQDMIIFVDGGMNYAEQTAYKCSTISHKISVGDGDSYNGKKQHDVIASPQKDDSDLTIALKQITPHVQELQLYGFIGGRRDHELFNMGEVLHFLDTNSKISHASFYMNQSSWSYLALPAGQHSISINQGETFSLLTIFEQSLTIEGNVRYKGEDITLKPLSSQGLSNVATGPFSIKCHRPVMIMRDLNE